MRWGTAAALSMALSPGGHSVIGAVPCLRGVRVAARGATAPALAAAMLIAVGTLRDSLSSRGTIASESVGTEWLPFEPTEITRRVSTGEVVFVDVTADWCPTCKANKAMSRYGDGFGRIGTPFSVVDRPGAPEGVVLPLLLIADTVMDALDQAGTREFSRTE